MSKYLTCWEEKGKKRWEVTNNKDNRELCLELLQNPKVDNHSIFIIPVTGGFVQGIWLIPDGHKSDRVDFWNFHEDYGKEYVRPKLSETTKKIVAEIEDQRGSDTKYGWLSPDGRYFHCNYQGHASLAHDICFGFIETNNAEQYLEEHGWCKIFKPLGDKKYCVYIGGKHVITDAQMKKLIELGLDDAKGVSAMLVKE